MIDNREISDEVLYQRMRQGSREAMDMFFRRHYVLLCQVSARFVGATSEAEDIVQDQFLHFWSKRGRMPLTLSNPVGYFRRSVRNRALNYLRSHNSIEFANVSESTDLRSEIQQPGVELEQEELRLQIHQSIKKLPQRCRMVFVMVRLEGMSHKEVANKMNISTKTVENQMTRAYTFLKKCVTVMLFYSWIITS